MISYSDISEIRPKRKRKNPGVCIVERLIPSLLIKWYLYERRRLLPVTSPQWRTGWAHPTSYMHVPSMLEMALYRPLTELLKEEIGEEMGLHLTLTGFQSTQRKWHADSYLNPPFVGDSYLAVWIALGDIHPDSGPFEYVPDSENWPVITLEKVWDKAPKEMRDAPRWNQQWPNLTQDFVGEACDQEIKSRGAEIKQFLGKAGDVLIWDSDLIHRGSVPVNPELERPALICHYSAITKRQDMPKPVQHTNSSWYFPINTKGTY